MKLSQRRSAVDQEHLDEWQALYAVGNGRRVTMRDGLRRARLGTTTSPSRGRRSAPSSLVQQFPRRRGRPDGVGFRRDAASSSWPAALSRSDAAGRTEKPRHRPGSCRSRRRGHGGSRRPAGDAWSSPSGSGARATGQVLDVRTSHSPLRTSRSGLKAADAALVGSNSSTQPCRA